MTSVPVRARAGTGVGVAVERIGSGVRAVVARSRDTRVKGAIDHDDGLTIAAAARHALASRLPLVLVVASSGADVSEGLPALHGWGSAAHAVAACSGQVPVAMAVTGPAISGPALLLGLADLVCVCDGSYAFVSGPAMVQEMTGVRLSPSALGGPAVHARASGVATLLAVDEAGALDQLGEALSFLPACTDRLAPRRPTDDPVDRSTERAGTLIPATATGGYDVREVVRELADDGELVELSAAFAPSIVTGFAAIGSHVVGVVANQPSALAGTLDITSSQKAARFVNLCDTMNVALLTLVDTPGFFPGKDLEWRGMIRHGAELAFAYARATVPRVGVVLRKAYGGAYIVMDCKAIGNDFCVAWPSAEVAVMGAKGAVEILHRRATPTERAEHQRDYEADFLNPWVAAERGFVDAVIDPADTRQVVAQALDVLWAKREHLVARKHSNTPL